MTHAAWDAQFPTSKLTAPSTSLEGYGRFEDFTQDGRLTVFAVPPTVSWLWRDVIRHLPGAAAWRAQGIVPILSRLVIQCSDEATRLDQPLIAHMQHELRRASNGQACYFLIGGELTGQQGPWDGTSPPATASVRAATVFAEHIFTKPFAPPAERKVTALEVPGFSAAHATAYDALAPATLATPPAPFAACAPAWTSAPVRLTLDDTDANQHINSIVYLRLALQAAAALRAEREPTATPYSVRAIEIAFRRPCFAGDALSATLQPYGTRGLAAGVSGVLTRNDDTQPCAYVRLAWR